MGIMDDKDKTLKLRAYPEPAKSVAPQTKPADGQDSSLELAKAQLEEEKSKTLELLKTIVQLRESLKQEQAKAADLEAKLNRLGTVEDNQLAKKNAQLEAEMKRSIELMSTIEQLRESLKQEQARSAGEVDRTAALEAKVRDLSALLGKISTLAAAGKTVGDA
jgi:DNA anti-recombination protein RmuC